MATEVAIRVSTEGADKAVQKIDELEQSISKAKGSANEMNQSVDALEGVFDAFGSNAIGQFKSLQKSGSNLLKNFGTLRKTGIKGLITGFKGLKMAIASTGIGLLLTLLPDVINAISGFIMGTDKAAEAQKRLNAEIDAHRKISIQVLADFDKISAIEAIRGQSDQDRIKRAGKRLELEKKQLEADEARVRASRHAARLIRDEDDRKAEIERLTEERFANLQRRQQIERELEINTARLKAQIRKESEETNAKLEKQAEERARKAQERADEEKARLEELQALRQQARQRELQEEQDFQAQLEQMEEEAYLRTLSDDEREVLAVQDKYFQLLTEAEQFGMDTAFLEEEQQLALQQIRDRYEAERREKEQANAAERQKELDGEFKQQADNAKAIAEANEALQDAKLGAIKGGIEAGKALAGENEQLQNAFFIAEKAVAVGEVIINGIREKASNAVQAAQFGLSFGAAAPAATAGMLATLNAATNLRMGVSLATLAATTFAKFKNGGGGASGSAGGGGGGGVGAVSVGAPQQQTLTPITGESIDTTGVSQPVQAYVIGQDITNQQALDSELRLRSTL